MRAPGLYPNENAFANPWPNFCLGGAHDGHHVTGRVSGADYFRTDQQVLKQHACWNDVAAIAGGVVPAAPPNNATNPPADPTPSRVGDCGCRERRSGRPG